MAQAPWVSPRHDCFPRCFSAPTDGRRRWNSVFPLWAEGIRGQSRFCLAHKPNRTAIKPDLIWFVFPLMCSYAEFRGFLIHSLFWALLIVDFSKKHDHHPLASCRAAGRAGRAGYIAEGCSAFPPMTPSETASCLPCFHHFQLQD